MLIQLAKSLVSPSYCRSRAEELLSIADVQINGSRPWDIQVNNDRFFSRVMKQGTLGLGESYMDHDWEVKSLDELFNKVLCSDLIKHKPTTLSSLFLDFQHVFLNIQSESRSKQVATVHYNLGNDFYKKMLDSRMLYTCGYWRNATTLDQAQVDKLQLICDKIELKQTDTVLDLGCGFGSFAKYAAEKYGCQVVGVNISSEQLKYARESCKGLPVEFMETDYRNIKNRQFDKIVSIGLCEHVGAKNHRILMQVAHDNLKDEGLFLLHTIGQGSSQWHTEPFTHKYIFPNGLIPSITQLGKAMEGLFVMEDWHNFGADYDKTLMAWNDNFQKHWPTFQSQFDDKFHRMWEYYLLSSAGSFRARSNQLWHLVLSKKGVKGGYLSRKV